MLMGRHGIGKSEIITSYYHSKKMKVVSFFLGQMSDPGDLIGLMNKNEKTGISEFLPPFWWPVDGQAIVLFLDELNRARPEILQAVMDLTLNKTLAGKELPQGSVIIAAVNQGDRYQLTDLDPALVSRFNLYHFDPTLDDWLRWANDNQIDQRVIDFVSEFPHLLDGEDLSDAPSQVDAMSGLVKTPDRRAWARVSDLIKPFDHIEPIHIKMIAGVVGAKAANTMRKALARPLAITPEQLLLEFSKCRMKLQKMSIAELVMMNDQVLLKLSTGTLQEERAKKARRSLIRYFQLLRKRKLDEAVAHFVAGLDKPQNETVMDWLSESMELTTLLTEYMDGIRVE